jgi:hypothetical protein
MMLTVCQPECERSRKNCERYIEHNDKGTAPVPQEQQHNQRSEDRAETALKGKAVDCARDVWRLIELVADRNIVRKHRLETREILLHQIDDGERRCISPLGYGYVDRAPAIDECISGLNVGAVLDRADIAQKYCLGALGAYRNVSHVLNVGDNGIDGDHRHEVADAHVS